MSAFRAILEAKSRLPGRFATLAPEAFAESWRNRPDGPVKVGLRRVSDTSIQTARAEAAKYAIMMHDDREGQVDAFNDALVRWILVAGTCDEEDTSKPSPIFMGDENAVRDALTSESIRYLWDEYERYHFESSPIVSALSNEEIVLLAKRLVEAPLPNTLSRSMENRIRKLLGFVMSEIVGEEGELAEHATEPLSPTG